MVKVYGASDDLVEIENSKYAEDEIGCFDKDVMIRFKDDTVISVIYGDDGIWRIGVITQGTAKQGLTVCESNGDDDDYSDIFEIDAEVAMHYVIAKGQLENR